MRKWGKLAALGVAFGMMAAGCSSGETGVLTNPGNAGAPFPAGRFLPAVNTVDSGQIDLADGKFDGAGDNLVFTEPFSTSRVRIADQTVFSGNDQIFDTDGDKDYDYIILTMRALSAQAVASTAAQDALGASVGGGTFYKVAGVAVLPPQAAASIAAEITLPVDAAGAPAAGKQYQLYRWESSYAGPGTAHSTGAGVWKFVSNVTVDSTGNTVTFPVTRLGEYAVVSGTINVTGS